MTSNDALILELAADLAPVTRRSAVRDGLWLLGFAAAELLLILAMGAMRPDMGRVILSVAMLWKMGGLALLAGLSGAVAMRSFTPFAAPRRGVRIALGLALALVVAGLCVASPAENGQAMLVRLAPAHGWHCVVAIILLALPMLAMLAVLMRRAAPVHPEQSALAAGLAASTCGALVFTACCPMNDPLYIIVWYSAGVATITTAARWLLPRRFRL